MFLENGFLTTNRFWKYIVGSLIIISAHLIGQLPFLAALAMKSMMTGKEFPSTDKEVMTFLSSNSTLFFILISFVFAFAAIVLVVRNLHEQTLLSLTTSREKVDRKRIFFSFSLWSIFTVGATLMMYYSSPENFIFNFKPIPFLVLSIIAILLIPIQTSTEEYVFRGYLMQGFALLTKNRWFPLIMTSVIFGTMHIANPEVEKMGYIILIYYIGTGLFLGIITLMDEGIELALGFHAANNLITALLVTSDWSAFQTNSIFKDVSSPSVDYEILIPIFIIFPILLFIFSKKYSWNNWSEKLTGRIKLKNEQPINNMETNA